MSLVLDRLNIILKCFLYFIYYFNFAWLLSQSASLKQTYLIKSEKNDGFWDQF